MLRWSAGGFSYLATGQFTRPARTAFGYDFRGHPRLAALQQPSMPDAHDRFH